MTWLDARRSLMLGGLLFGFGFAPAAHAQFDATGDADSLCRAAANQPWAAEEDPRMPLRCELLPIAHEGLAMFVVHHASGVDAFVVAPAGPAYRIVAPLDSAYFGLDFHQHGRLRLVRVHRRMFAEHAVVALEMETTVADDDPGVAQSMELRWRTLTVCRHPPGRPRALECGTRVPLESRSTDYDLRRERDGSVTWDRINARTQRSVAVAVIRAREVRLTLREGSWESLRLDEFGLEAGAGARSILVPARRADRTAR